MFIVLVDLHCDYKELVEHKGLSTGGERTGPDWETGGVTVVHQRDVVFGVKTSYQADCVQLHTYRLEQVDAESRTPVRG